MMAWIVVCIIGIILQFAQLIHAFYVLSAGRIVSTIIGLILSIYVLLVVRSYKKELETGTVHKNDSE